MTEILLNTIHDLCAISVENEIAPGYVVCAYCRAPRHVKKKTITHADDCAFVRALKILEEERSQS